MKIGEALKEERLKLGLSIRKMADGIIDPTFYSRVEQEHRNIGSEALVRSYLLVKLILMSFSIK